MIYNTPTLGNHVDKLLTLLTKMDMASYQQSIINNCLRTKLVIGEELGDRLKRFMVFGRKFL